VPSLGADRAGRHIVATSGAVLTELVTGLQRNEQQFHQAIDSFLNQLHAVNLAKQANIFEQHVSFKIEVAYKMRYFKKNTTFEN
jgi:hypothetical protein